MWKTSVISIRVAGMTANSIAATGAISAGGWVFGPLAIGFSGIVLGA